MDASATGTCDLIADVLLLLHEQSAFGRCYGFDSHRWLSWKWFSVAFHFRHQVSTGIVPSCQGTAAYFPDLFPSPSPGEKDITVEPLKNKTSCGGCRRLRRRLPEFRSWGQHIASLSRISWCLECYHFSLCSAVCIPQQLLNWEHVVSLTLPSATFCDFLTDTDIQGIRHYPYLCSFRIRSKWSAQCFSHCIRGVKSRSAPPTHTANFISTISLGEESFPVIMKQNGKPVLDICY